MQSGKYVIKDSIRYAYDEMGNITKVYENGELAARYKYGALSSLIREDNKTFGKTWLYNYDNNGNILKQRAFAFTMKDEEELEELYVGEPGIRIQRGQSGIVQRRVVRVR